MRPLGHYRSTQFRYALTYVLITAFVLLFLNYYCSKSSQELFFQSKKASMIEKCQMTAADIAKLEVINPSTVHDAVSQMGNLNVTRLVITDRAGAAVYDSMDAGGSSALRYLLFPEIVRALESNRVFTGEYHDGLMHSHAAVPVFSYGSLVGCVYMMEYDAEQGALVKSLERNILIITIILELVVILYSAVFTNAFSARLRRIMASMRVIREGDYSQTVKMGGNDELTMLGDEFNDLTVKLQTSEQKRRQFVSDASHELKTPLASIKLLTDSILQNDMDMDTLREFVGDIGNEADRLNRMSQKLLSLTKIEGQEDGDCEIVYMAPTIQRVARMISTIAEENRISVDLDLADDCPILILEDDLYQIAFNLAENGIKYNLPGGTLTIRVHREEDNAVLTVTDSGVGIPEEAISHVFERFYRVDKARSRKSGGSGLGLAIVRNMVERNGGVIRVSSTEGKGSAFTVTFPVFDAEVDK